MLNDEIEKKYHLKIKKKTQVRFTHQTHDTGHKTLIETTINHEVQFSINQILNNKIRKK
jgi:hypothetical protein